MLLMLFLGMGAYAQTTVEFVAGTDKGSNSQFGFLAASDQIEKDGVTMSSDNAVFDADVYQTQKTAFSNRKLTFSSKKNITKIEFEGGENLALLTADSFDASTGVWSGKATDIRFTISSKGLVKFTKVTVTLDDKKVTTLAFADAETVAYVDLTKKSYTFPVVLKHDDTELKGMPIRYESTNPEVATIDATGNVEPKTVGTTVLKAFFDGNDSYEPSQAEVTFNVVDGKNIFTETFDKMKDEGGNDGNFNVWGSGNLSSGDCDNAGWSHSGVGNGKADKCVRIEMSASLTTPALTNLKGNAFLFFRAAQNRNAATSIDLSISGGGSLSEKSVKLEKTFNDYVVLIKDGTPETKIKFSCSAFGCFFLDDVKIERAIVLDEATDNAQTLSDNDKLTVNVAFNRPLSPDYWNTVALPFDVQAADMSKIFGEDVKVKAFDRWDAAAQTLFFKDAAAAGVEPVAVVLAQVEAGGQTGGTAIAVGFVVAVEQPILLGLTSHNVEQVASERLAHIPALHGGLVGLGLGLGEQVGVLEGAGKAVTALLLIGFAVYASLLHGVELAQGGGIDGAQHGRLGALLFGSHLRSHGVERVGRYLDGQPSTGYLCLDQMAVGFLGSGAHDDLVEHGDGSAWLPCSGSLVIALPERGVGVGSRCPHHGDEHQSE